MPIRKITELDNTGAVQVTATSNTVYIPGLAKADAIEPKLFKTKAALDEVKDKYQDDLSFKLAQRLLQLGLYVLFEGCSLTDSAKTKKVLVEDIMTKSLKESSADDYVWKFTIDKVEYTLDQNTITWESDSSTKNATLTEGKAILKDNIEVVFDFINNKISYSKEVPDGGNPVINWERLKNKTLYNIRFLTTGGYACPDSSMIDCASARGDCVALIDHQKDQFSDYAVDDVKEYFKTYGSEYAAGFTPWFNTRNDILGGDSKTEVAIPASFGYLMAYAKSIKNNPSWLPVAGASRGIIDDLTSVLHEYTEAEINSLQGRTELDNDADNVGIAINPIAYMGESFGYLIWGNRTLIENDSAKHLTAKSFLNVRNLVSELKKQIEAASLKYTFEPNNDVLWINWQAYLTPTLNKMESGAGILGYKLIREKTTAKARLKAKVVIVPIEGVEDFDINVELSDSLDIEEE